METRTKLCTRCALGTGAHSSECRARFATIWTKELAEAEVACHADDRIPVGLDVKERESLESAEAAGQLVEMEGASTDQDVERAGGASPQLDEEQVQLMDKSLDQNATTGATRTPHRRGLRSFDGQQVEHAQLMLAMEVAKGDFSVDTIGPRQVQCRTNERT